MAFSTFTVLCNHRLCLVPRPFHHLGGKLHTRRQPLPTALLATTRLLSFSVDSSTPDISCKWNHTTSSLLCLTSFTQHNVLKVHPHCGTCQNFLLSCGWMIFPSMDTRHFILPVHPSMDGHLGCFHLLAFVIVKLLSILVCLCFQFFWACNWEWNC